MRKLDVCTFISVATMILGFVVLALLLPTVAGCQSAGPTTGPTWVQSHPLPDVLNHAAPVAVGAGVLASTGNPAPLTTSIFDFVKYLLASGGGAVATVGAAKLKTRAVVASGRDRREHSRAGQSQPPPTPPPATPPPAAAAALPFVPRAA